jgi:hypothetical protein
MTDPATDSGADPAAPPPDTWATIEVPVATLPAGAPPGPKKSGGVNADAFKNFDDVVAILRITKGYAALNGADRAMVEKIIRNARRSPLREYYLSWLDKLVCTPDAPPGDVSAANQAELDQSVDQEKTRQSDAAKADPAQAKRDMNREEDASADPSRRWTTLTGGADATDKAKTFRVDRSDLRNIVVQVKVHLRGTSAATKAVEFVEDAIEKFAGVPGYSIDLVFVHPKTNPDSNDQRDVFEVNATTEGWTNRVTWGADATALTHELHHLLGLDDRYDYIEAHATNASMTVHDRLHWFDVQMTKNRHRRPEMTQEQGDPDGVHNSVMGDDSHNKPLDSDICAVVQAKNQQKCQQTRASSPPSAPSSAPSAPSSAPSPAAGP